MDLTSSNIQLIASVQTNIGLSFASPSITLSGRNKLDVGLRLVQQLFNIYIYHFSSVIGFSSENNIILLPDIDKFLFFPGPGEFRSDGHSTKDILS